MAWYGCLSTSHFGIRGLRLCGRLRSGRGVGTAIPHPWAEASPPIPVKIFPKEMTTTSSNTNFTETQIFSTNSARSCKAVTDEFRPAFLKGSSSPYNPEKIQGELNQGSKSSDSYELNYNSITPQMPLNRQF